MYQIKLKKFFYNNKWKLPSSNIVFNNKTSNDQIIKIPICGKKDVNKTISAAIKGQNIFNSYSNKKKSKILNQISIKIKNEADLLAKKESIELGKSFINAKKEMIACSNLWKHASEIIKKKKDKLIIKDNKKLYEILEPIGVVALIIPWNFPMIVLSERLPYILAAGNTVVIKPSENGTLSIDYFIKILKNSNLPKGTVNYLTGNHKTGKYLAENKNISMISFTGSTKTGKEIYKNASTTLKRLSLELGGKNPMVVFSDANLNKSCNEVIYSFTHNAGQCCVSGSRLFIEKKISLKFIEKIKKKLSKLDCKQSITTINQYLKIKKIILKAIKKKVPIIYRNEKLFDDKKRIIYPIIFNTKKKIDFLEDEIFGPVLTVRFFKDISALVGDMNDTNYGLSALIWTKNYKKGLDIASKIKSGRIWINGDISQNYPDLAIGGFKESGINRETGDSGLRTYSEIKSIILNK
ncbi:aldehyde dehydrogenase family protein [Candidatus Pelagibacter sp.]|nr:aldehyde dehydrogenase family protein [Candidatus Pelagibacter sp.]